MAKKISRYRRMRKPSPAPRSVAAATPITVSTIMSVKRSFSPARPTA